MTKQERSIEGIVEEFNKRFTVPNKNKKMSSGTVINELITPKTISNWLTKTLQAERQKRGGKLEINEDTSDGYHTFKELYEFRLLYNALLFNEWAANGKYDVHKSQRHSDGEECFGGGWFIVVAVLPTGQISNHYEMKDWDLFKCEEVEKAKYEWDGHTSQDVALRLREELERNHKHKNI